MVKSRQKNSLEKLIGETCPLQLQNCGHTNVVNQQLMDANFVDIQVPLGKCVLYLVKSLLYIVFQNYLSFTQVLNIFKQRSLFSQPTHKEFSISCFQSKRFLLLLNFWTIFLYLILYSGVHICTLLGLMFSPTALSMKLDRWIWKLSCYQLSQHKEIVERRHGEPIKFLFLHKMGLLGSQAGNEKNCWL